jgi:TonB family protein
MFEAMPLGIEPSSRRRAALAAFVLHGTIIFVALHGTRGSGQPLSRPLLDTVRIELPRAPTPQTVADVAPREQSPLVPGAPGVPRLGLESPHPATLKLDSSKLDQVLATIRSMATGPSGRDSSPGDTAVVGVSEVDRLPELLRDLTPRYPDELRRAGLGGETLLEYVIDREGRVVPGSIRVLGASHPAFAQSAIEALKRARFNPARRAGRSIAVLVSQRIRFESRESY